MTVPNELIGCIIGKGGSKVAEIRFDVTFIIESLDSTRNIHYLLREAIKIEKSVVFSTIGLD